MTAAATAIIPVAGVGTRLRPHTHTQPKVLLHVAGKPILAHILDQLPGLGITRAVLIVGYLGDRVREFVANAYPNLDVRYVDQPEAPRPRARGRARRTAHRRRAGAGDPGRHHLRRRSRIACWRGETSAIGVKEVDGPAAFRHRRDQRRRSRLAHDREARASDLESGDHRALLLPPAATAVRGAARAAVARNMRTRGEFQLTDGMQLMVDRGEVMRTFPVEGWYDCGKIETLLETNRILLDRRPGAAGPARIGDRAAGGDCAGRGGRAQRHRAARLDRRQRPRCATPSCATRS